MRKCAEGPLGCCHLFARWAAVSQSATVTSGVNDWWSAQARIVWDSLDNRPLDGRQQLAVGCLTVQLHAVRPFFTLQAATWHLASAVGWQRTGLPTQFKFLFEQGA